MLGGAPEAHEVLSKTPRVKFQFVVGVLAEAASVGNSVKLSNKTT
jgi:hypothetical protein